GKRDTKETSIILSHLLGNQRLESQASEALSILQALGCLVQDRVRTRDQRALTVVADRLGLNPQALEQIFCKTQKRESSVSSRLDELIKTLYFITSHRILKCINDKLSNQGSHSIGILDFSAPFDPGLCPTHLEDPVKSYINSHIFEKSLSEYKQDCANNPYVSTRLALIQKEYQSFEHSLENPSCRCIYSIDNTLPSDLVSLLQSSQLPIVSGLLDQMNLKTNTVSMNDLFLAMDKTVHWFALLIQLDSTDLQEQVKALKLVSITKRFKAVKAFAHSFTHQEFCDRYQLVIDDYGIRQNMTPVFKCQALSDLLNNSLHIGTKKVFIEYKAWKDFEDILCQTEFPIKDVSDGFSAVHTMTSDTNTLNSKPTKSHQYNDDLLKETVDTIERFTVPSNSKTSNTRKGWLFLVWLTTWWIPSPLLYLCGMKLKDIQIAWREKFTLCSLILLISTFIMWFLVFFGKLVCPHQDIYSPTELQERPKSKNALVSIRGEVFDLTRFAPHHWASQVIPESFVLSYAGQDITNLFPVQVSALCQGLYGSVSEYVSLDYHFNTTDARSDYHDFRAWTDDYRPDWYFEQMIFLRKNYKVGNLGYSQQEVFDQATRASSLGGTRLLRNWAILDDKIFDLTFYVAGGRHIRLPDNYDTSAIDVNYLADVIVNLFVQKSGQDITRYWKSLPLDPELRLRQEVCLRNLFYAGRVDHRRSLKCLFSEYLLLIVTLFLCLVIVFKFLAALQLGTRRDPEFNQKFVICQVSCYTEGKEELKKTIDSITTLKYDDKQKLLFIVCDGMVTGGSNDRPTPMIVLDILDIDPDVNPDRLSFYSIGDGQRQHNMGQVYSGLYEHQGHVIPYLVIVKVGKPSERQKPGNRGKRDSQLVLMRFLNKAFFDAPMTPMEIEMYYQMENVIGVSPGAYEFVLMVDADTEVMPDGLNHLVSAFVHDAKIIGLCGETRLSNEKDTWVTMIQVYEYFISHYMIKAFESLFGTVTCLPGCFCMYRLRSLSGNQPFLISNQVIQEYQVNRVDTLHQKNLLHLGEDRYLTTLILKHFPRYKTKFVADAQCATNAPDQWNVLLSQRRRWINSTIHNLGELVFLPHLCGFCCFSMRFVVMLDLLSTLVQPAIVGYLGYLIYTLATSSDRIPLISIVTIGGVYGLQAVIFILHQKWEHLAWMVVSIFAIPAFSFFIPIYSYWHFDDFSWGNTRVVLSEQGERIAVHADEDDHFNPDSIPTMTWKRYEQDLKSEFAHSQSDDMAISEVYRYPDIKESFRPYSPTLDSHSNYY
ncbi:hypothetical protein CU098_000359, partial [Rhizopus stolonifer]